MQNYLNSIATMIWLPISCIVVVNGCASYNVGNQFLYRSDIRTVHVEIFESDSYRKFLGQRLTEAVIKQIELNTPLTITEPALADSFVKGRLIRDEKRVVSENRGDEPNNILIDFRVEVSWVDRAGVPLMQRQIVRFDREVTFVPEGGPSMATAQQKLIDRIARELVGQMETPW